jgi:anti-sigma regulatory factor (Ser/Thr protein kinase)
VGEKFQTSLAAELESLAKFREFIKSICQRYPQVSAEHCYDLQLAVDEACTNIIQHGYVGMNPGSMILALEVRARQVNVTLTDFGHPFEPSEPDRPDVQAELEDGVQGGFGLFFIYQTMDQVDYETTGAGNRLKFVKELSSGN